MLSLSLSVLLFFFCESGAHMLLRLQTGLKIILVLAVSVKLTSRNMNEKHWPRPHVLFLSSTRYILQHEIQTRMAILHVNVSLCSGSRLCYAFDGSLSASALPAGGEPVCHVIISPGCSWPWGGRPLKKFGVYRLRPSWVAKKAGA